MITNFKLFGTNSENLRIYEMSNTVENPFKNMIGKFYMVGLNGTTKPSRDTVLHYINDISIDNNWYKLNNITFHLNYDNSNSLNISATRYIPESEIKGMRKIELEKLFKNFTPMTTTELYEYNKDIPHKLYFLLKVSLPGLQVIGNKFRFNPIPQIPFTKDIMKKLEEAPNIDILIQTDKYNI